MPIRVPGHSSEVPYRPDVDGLRALAVAAVIAFHLTPAFPGGFVGVDVFFVISGFLISSLILKQLSQGTFSLAGFYNRRIRRILPALLVVLLSTAFGAWFVLFPADYTRFGRSLIASALSFSNFFFAAGDGYFKVVDQSEPLIHTWSLAVEEQFYLVFPLYLLLVHRWARGRIASVVLLTAALSFMVSAVSVRADQTTTFYWPHTRAWELLLGVLVALRMYPQMTSTQIRVVVAAAGLALVMGSMLLLDRAVLFPGPAALPACLGTAMIIAAGADGPNLVGRILSARPLVFTGLLSYSLYLWHWPLIVLVRQYTTRQALDAREMALTLGGCIALSLVSWTFVERPLRRARGAHRRVFAMAGAGLTTAVLVGVVIVAGGGAPSRFSPEVVRIASYLDYPHDSAYRKGICFIGTGWLDEETCLQRRAGVPNVLLFGDSYAAHLWPGLSRALAGANLLEAAVPGCTPTFRPGDEGEVGLCPRVRDFVFSRYLPNTPPDALILAGDWKMRDITLLSRTLDRLLAAHLNVILVGPVPLYDAPVPYLLARGLHRGLPDLVASHLVAGTATIDDSVAALAARKGVQYWSPFKAVCPDRRCRELVPGGVPTQWDHRHFTVDGSAFVIDAVMGDRRLP